MNVPAVCWPRELGVPRWFSCACVSVCSGTDFAPPARPPLDRMGRGLTFGCPSTERQSVQSTTACLEFCCAYGSAPTVTVSRLKGRHCLQGKPTNPHLHAGAYCKLEWRCALQYTVILHECLSEVAHWFEV